MILYLIGSLKQDTVCNVAAALRMKGHEVFEDWYAAGKIADQSWQEYETRRGRTYEEALRGYAAEHVFHFDLHHLKRADAGVLVMPAGKSGHLELGFIIGTGKPGYVLFDKEPEHWDVMYRFANSVHFSIDSLIRALDDYHES